MNDYVIFTDSACDIKEEDIKSWDVLMIQMTFMLDGDEKVYLDHDIATADFYGMMRDGKTAKTSAINEYTFREYFVPVLEEGKDILYICFSSGLSTTYNVALNAAEGLEKEHPERKVKVVDSLSASAGQGLLVFLASEMKRSGASIEEAEKFIYDSRLNICHWFTVDDLVYLKRGGRISKTTALIGDILGIKPVMHMDGNGKLCAVSKVRGRKLALKSIAEKYGETALNTSDGVVFISHGDCIDDAKLLGRMINEKYGAEIRYYSDIGPVIGSHSGPGTLAMFFVGKTR